MFSLVDPSSLFCPLHGVSMLAMRVCFLYASVVTNSVLASSSARVSRGAAGGKARARHEANQYSFPYQTKTETNKNNDETAQEGLLLVDDFVCVWLSCLLGALVCPI